MLNMHPMYNNLNVVGSWRMVFFLELCSPLYFKLIINSWRMIFSLSISNLVIEFWHVLPLNFVLPPSTILCPFFLLGVFEVHIILASYLVTRIINRLCISTKLHVYFVMRNMIIENSVIFAILSHRNQAQ
jgi:hypothetical protein